MYPRPSLGKESTSTPKRRRLGVSKVFRSTQRFSFSQNDGKNSPKSGRSSPCHSPCIKEEDEPLPCNQNEFLCGSGTNSCSCIPCSPGIVESPILKNLETWECLDVSINPNKSLKEASKTILRELNELEDISDNLFESKLEQESSQYKCANELSTSKSGKHLREAVEESFDLANKSILQNEISQVEKSSLFETINSFLLDIKESDIVQESKKNYSNDSEVIIAEITDSTYTNNNTFYGLPIITKELFKSYRNIEKFYDWQEECLNLPAIRQRRNLIYALPTSGGKTLVAEVLMLRELLCRRKNALFVLPFVAIVQEKMWSLSPFAVQLDFLLEEYAGGKGHIPPKKRRKKNSLYIATIEKALALVRSLIELDRLSEIGLVVVDELHLIGEENRGGTLETLLSTILFTKLDIQIVGMSATIGNVAVLASYLHADMFTREFRPVELTEYVKLGTRLHKLVWSQEGLEVLPDRQLTFSYTAAGASVDPDFLGGLVSEVVPQAACLVFCPTKKNCENVAVLLCKVQRKEMSLHRNPERYLLSSALRAEGASPDLVKLVLYGVAYHHAGLATDERNLLENAYRSGVISVLCCTSTLAAGVNLPAARVIVRAPLVGSQMITLAAYKQMAGRAGRAGIADNGDSIIICSDREWPQLRNVLSSGLAPAKSVFRAPGALSGLVLSAVALNLAKTRAQIRQLLECTLLAGEAKFDSTINMKEVCDDCLRILLKIGALDVLHGCADMVVVSASTKMATDYQSIKMAVDSVPSKMVTHTDDLVIYNDTPLAVSKLGMAAIKGCMDLQTANHLLSDLELAGRGLVVLGSLHLLYLVTPYDAAGIKPDYRHYYALYCNLDDEGIQTAKMLGITEMNAIRMMTGQSITNVPERVLRRFYLAMMLSDLWKHVPFAQVADKYCVSRGALQSVLTSSSSFAWSAHKACEQLEHLWTFRTLFNELASRLQHCTTPELRDLMELPAVQKGRAMQLLKAGYKRIEDVAKASAEDLVNAIAHLPRKTATHLISSARMMLIEKVENLRADAEDLMEELNAK